MVKIPTPTFEILNLLADTSAEMTPSQIQKALPTFSPKDTKYALRRLREKGVIKQIPNLLDMRRVYYRLATPDELNESAELMKEEELELYVSAMEGELDIIASYERDQEIKKNSRILAEIN